MNIPDEDLTAPNNGDNLAAGRENPQGEQGEGSNSDEETFEDATNDERWAEATAASEPAFTLEPEKGIQVDGPNENNDGLDKDDYNAKQ
jgi:hypothetical protein